MSNCNTTQITCPKCQHPQDFTIWNSVNVDLDSSLKDQILSGELTRFKCDQCQHTSEVVYPLLYHDMTRKMMVNFVAGGDISELVNQPLGAMMGGFHGYQFRIVTSRNELIEKIWIAEAGLDDRAMELFKLSLIGQMDASEGDELLFAGEERKSDGSHFAKFALLNQGGIEPITTHMESYTEFAAGIAGVLELEPATPGEWLRINHGYAQLLMEKYTSGGSA